MNGSPAGRKRDAGARFLPSAASPHPRGWNFLWIAFSRAPSTWV